MGSKAKNRPIDQAYLDSRTAALASSGFRKSKWIEFCEAMLNRGLRVNLYEARRTVSKYVTVRASGKKAFKVRFSNHKPIRAKEAGNDCDFFVGRTHFATTTTSQAIAATLSHFGIAECAGAGR